MPAVRKTTHFTDGALFSFLSHPRFLVPLLVTSPWSLSLSPRPVPFPGSASRLCLPVLSPGSVSPVPLLILITVPFLLLFTFPFQLRLQFSLPTPSPSPLHPPFHLPFRFPSATQFFWHKSVYREQKNHHYRQNSAATQAFRLKRMCRERLHCHFGSNERWHGTQTHLGRFEGHNRLRYDVFPVKITNSFTPRSFFFPKTSKVY